MLRRLLTRLFKTDPALSLMAEEIDRIRALYVDALEAIECGDNLRDGLSADYDKLEKELTEAKGQASATAEQYETYRTKYRELLAEDERLQAYAGKLYDALSRVHHDTAEAIKR